jgi:site-specific recombinase XerD
MIRDMELRGLAPGTQRTYVEAIRNLAAHYRRSPEVLSEEEVRAFFVYLAKERRLAASTLRVYLFAIKFLFQKTLGRTWPVLGHRTLKTTFVYLHLTQSTLKAVHGTVDALMADL